MINDLEKARKSAKSGKFVSVLSSMKDTPSRTKHYDPLAPKFVYRRKFGSFTRKSNKYGANEELILNKVSLPSSKKRPYAEYPATKPMIGWDRVFVGRGRWAVRGRRKFDRSRNNPSHNLISRPFRPKFVPFARTYRSNLSKNPRVIDEQKYKHDWERHVGRKVLRK